MDSGEVFSFRNKIMICSIFQRVSRMDFWYCRKKPCSAIYVGIVMILKVMEESFGKILKLQ